jgi:hypothetical protein
MRPSAMRHVVSLRAGGGVASAARARQRRGRAARRARRAARGAPAGARRRLPPGALGRVRRSRHARGRGGPHIGSCMRAAAGAAPPGQLSLDLWAPAKAHHLAESKRPPPSILARAGARGALGSGACADAAPPCLGLAAASPLFFGRARVTRGPIASVVVSQHAASYTARRGGGGGAPQLPPSFPRPPGQPPAPPTRPPPARRRRPPPAAPSSSRRRRRRGGGCPTPGTP